MSSVDVELAQLTEEMQTLNHERKQTLERLNCKSAAELKKYDTKPLRSLPRRGIA